MLNSSDLIVEDLSFSYGKKSLLKALSMRVAPGEIHAVVGASGTGKSTLLRLIAGFERCTGGRIALGPKSFDCGRKFVEVQKRKVGLLFQDNTVFPHLTVRGNLDFVLSSYPPKLRKKEIQKLLRMLKIEELEDRYPGDISGGQRQRLAIAIALSQKPELLLLDEPFSNLDRLLKEELISEIRLLVKKLQLPTLFITHDLREAYVFADKVSLLKEGQFLQTGSPEELYNNPKHIDVMQAMGRCTVLSCAIGLTEILQDLGFKNFCERFCKFQYQIALYPEDIVVEECVDSSSFSSHSLRVIDQNFYGSRWLVHLENSAGYRILASSSYKIHEKAALCLKKAVNKKIKVFNAQGFSVDEEDEKIIPITRRPLQGVSVQDFVPLQ